MKRLCIFFLIFLLYAPPLSYSHENDEKLELPPEVHRALYKAQQLMNKKEYLKTSEELKRFIHKHPKKNHYLIEFTLGNALAMAEKKKQALTHYRAALELKPDYNPAWMNLGKTYYDLKQYGSAGHALVKGYETSEEKQPEALFNACSAFLMAEEKEKAMPYLEILVSGKLGSPKHEWVQSLFMVYIDLKLTQKAEGMLKRLVNRDGDNPLWWHLSYQFYVTQNHYQKAITSLIIYSYLTPLKRDEIILLGDLFGAIGVPLEAARYYEQALESDGKPEEYEKLISFLLAGHRPEKAREMANRAINKNPTAKLWSLLGQIFYKQVRYDNAFQAFGQSARLDPKNGEYPLMMGYCALQLQDKDKALLALKKASQFPRQRKIAKELLKQVASWKEG